MMDKEYDILPETNRNGLLKTKKYRQLFLPLFITDDTSDYNQLCVWEGTLLNEKGEEPSENDIKEFIRSLNKIMPKARFQYCCQINTLPDSDKDGNEIEGTGGRIDQFFYVHCDDINGIPAERRFFRIKWFEDVLGNGHASIYPKDFLKKHMPTWNGDNIRENNPGYEDIFKDVPY
jgi:hypothetical protein